MFDKKLLDSIQQYVDQGMDPNSIKQGLLQAGWSEKAIDKAISKITNQKIVKEESSADKNQKIVKPESPTSQSFVDKKIIFIVGGIIFIIISALFAYFFFSKAGFSEDIPKDFVPLGKLDSFIKLRANDYNSLAVNSSGPLKDAIQEGKIFLIMTDNKGKQIIDATGITIENGKIARISLKIGNPSFDIKFTEEMFDSIVSSKNPKLIFSEGYAKGNIKIKAYGKENKEKLGLLNSFVDYFFVI